MQNIKAEVDVPREVVTEIDGALGSIKHDLAAVLIKEVIDNDIFEFEHSQKDQYSEHFRMGGLYISYSDFGIIKNKLNDIFTNTSDEMQKTRIMELGALLNYRE